MPEPEPVLKAWLRGPHARAVANLAIINATTGRMSDTRQKALVAAVTTALADEVPAFLTPPGLDDDTVTRINSALVGWSPEYQQATWDGIYRALGIAR